MTTYDYFATLSVLNYLCILEIVYFLRYDLYFFLNTNSNNDSVYRLLVEIWVYDI